MVRRHCPGSVALRWAGLVAVIGHRGLGTVMRALVGGKGRCFVPVRQQRNDAQVLCLDICYSTTQAALTVIFV